MTLVLILRCIKYYPGSRKSAMERTLLVNRLQAVADMRSRKVTYIEDTYDAFVRFGRSARTLAGTAAAVAASAVISMAESVSPLAASPTTTGAAATSTTGAEAAPMDASAEDSAAPPAPPVSGRVARGRAWLAEAFARLNPSFDHKQDRAYLEDYLRPPSPAVVAAVEKLASETAASAAAAAASSADNPPRPVRTSARRAAQAATVTSATPTGEVDGEGEGELEEAEEARDDEMYAPEQYLESEDGAERAAVEPENGAAPAEEAEALQELQEMDMEADEPEM